MDKSWGVISPMWYAEASMIVRRLLAVSFLTTSFCLSFSFNAEANEPSPAIDNVLTLINFGYQTFTDTISTSTHQDQFVRGLPLGVNMRVEYESEGQEDFPEQRLTFRFLQFYSQLAKTHELLVPIGAGVPIKDSRASSSSVAGEFSPSLSFRMDFIVDELLSKKAFLSELQRGPEGFPSGRIEVVQFFEWISERDPRANPPLSEKFLILREGSGNARLDHTKAILSRWNQQSVSPSPGGTMPTEDRPGDSRLGEGDGTSLDQRSIVRPRDHVTSRQGPLFRLVDPPTSGGAVTQNFEGNVVPFRPSNTSGTSSVTGPRHVRYAGSSPDFVNPQGDPSSQGRLLFPMPTKLSTDTGALHQNLKRRLITEAKDHSISLSDIDLEYAFSIYIHHAFGVLDKDKLYQALLEITNDLSNHENIELRAASSVTESPDQNVTLFSTSYRPFFYDQGKDFLHFRVESSGVEWLAKNGLSRFIFSLHQRLQNSWLFVRLAQWPEEFSENNIGFGPSRGFFLTEPGVRLVSAFNKARKNPDGTMAPTSREKRTKFMKDAKFSWRDHPWSVTPLSRGRIIPPGALYLPKVKNSSCSRAMVLTFPNTPGK